VKPNEFWKPEYDALAQYNAEVSRGLLHTEEWKIKMRGLQIDYDARGIVFAKRNGFLVVGANEKGD
jgi:hypothetical protein